MYFFPSLFCIAFQDSTVNLIKFIAETTGNPLAILLILLFDSVMFDVNVQVRLTVEWTLVYLWYLTLNKNLLTFLSISSIFLINFSNCWRVFENYFKAQTSMKSPYTSTAWQASLSNNIKLAMWNIKMTMNKKRNKI